VGFHVFFSGGGEFHGDEFVTLGFEATDDFSDELSLDSVRFDHDVSALHGC